MMRKNTTASGAGIVFLLAAFAPGAAAARFDAQSCAAIGNVDVPYDVSFAADLIVFKSGGRRIVVAPGYVEVNDHRLTDAGLNATYYQDIRAFLRAAAEFPETAADFAKTAVMPAHVDARRTFQIAVTGLCRTILSLADDQKRMSAAFAEFASPVEITVAGPQRP